MRFDHLTGNLVPGLEGNLALDHLCRRKQRSTSQTAEGTGLLFFGTVAVYIDIEWLRVIDYLFEFLTVIRMLSNQYLRNI